MSNVILSPVDIASLYLDTFYSRLSFLQLMPGNFDNNLTKSYERSKVKFTKCIKKLEEYKMTDDHSQSGVTNYKWLNLS